MSYSSSSPDTDSSYASSSPPGLRLGRHLRSAREEQGYTIDQVASALCIRAVYIDALENGDNQKLPEMIYARGFVRSYAEYLKLDPNYCVKLFKEENQNLASDKSLVFLAPVNDNIIPSKLVILSSLAMCFLLLIFWSFLRSGDSASLENESRVLAEHEQPQKQSDLSLESEGITAVPAASLDSALPSANETESTSLQNADATASDAGIKPVPDSASPEAVPATGYVIKAESDAWLEIEGRDGLVIFSRILKAGESFTVPDYANKLLSTGNAGGLKAFIDGKQQQPFGALAEIKRNIPLAPSAANASTTNQAITPPVNVVKPIKKPVTTSRPVTSEDVYRPRATSQNAETSSATASSSRASERTPLKQAPAVSSDR